LIDDGVQNTIGEECGVEEGEVGKRFSRSQIFELKGKK
jgi:hypothetical protein